MIHCRGEYAGQVEEEEDAQAKAEEAKDEVSGQLVLYLKF